MFYNCLHYYFIPHNNSQLNACDCPHACSKIINLWGNCDRHFEQSIPRCAAWLNFNFVSRSFQRLRAILGCNGKWRRLKLSFLRLLRSSSYYCHSCSVHFIWSEVKVLSTVQHSVRAERSWSCFWPRPCSPNAKVSVSHCWSAVRPLPFLSLAVKCKRRVE